MGADPLEVPAAGLFITQEKTLTGSLLGSCNSHRDIPRFIALWKRGVLWSGFGQGEQFSLGFGCFR